VEIGLSKREVAKRARVSLTTVYALECGLLRDVYVGTVLKFAIALETSPAELLGFGAG
jgi:transcriptional regulator with XRE-family HTH domain